MLSNVCRDAHNVDCDAVVKLKYCWW